MKAPFLILGLIGLLFGCSRHTQTKEQVLNDKLLPLAREFILRNGLPYNADFGTNSVARYHVDFDSSIKGEAMLKLTNGCFFTLFWNGTNSEVRDYHDKTKVTFNLARASKAEIQAIDDLQLRNKLNDKTALELATHFFKLQGHKEEDFLPPEFGPNTWGAPSEPDYHPYPFYVAQWYRKDVNLSDREKGICTLPNIVIIVSGISSNMVEYEKCFMPVGRDF